MESEKPVPHQTDSGPNWLIGGGEMGKVIRSMDWSKTPLGSIEHWPQSLRTTVNLCLASNFPITTTWGPHHVQIYNDGYWPICGAKHPQSMGQNYTECWVSAWPVIGEPYDKALKGEASYLESQRIFLDRNGYLEETFFTSSFSPIRDESGRVSGVFHPITENTSRMLSERRLRTLRELAARTAKAQCIEETCILTTKTLGDYPLDIPFSLLYLAEDDARSARLVGCTGLFEGQPATPAKISLEKLPAPWLLADVAKSRRTTRVDNLTEKFGALHCGPYPEPIQTGLVLPIIMPGVSRPVAFLVAGVSTRRRLDDDYLGFFDLVAGHIAIAIGNARSFQEEKRRAEELASLDREKTAFFSNVSHELRTPLTLIVGPLEDMLRQNEKILDDSMRDNILLCYRNGLRLLKLVNTLLEFSRIEAGRIQACYEETNIAEFTTGLISVFRSACEKGGILLVADCPNLSEDIYVDRNMWEQIVLNLLSNALKFTKQGSIEVSQKVSKGFLELTVKDTGCGIPKSELSNVFKRFYRVEGIAGRTHEGTGIGLSLVEELTKLHGGSVTVDSEEDQGSVFRIQIPTGKRHLPPEKIKSEKSLCTAYSRTTEFLYEACGWMSDLQDESPVDALGHAGITNCEKGYVILADDNPDMRRYVERLLSPYYRVRAFADGEAAWNEIVTGAPDLVLTDVMMPKLDGFGLLKRLRANQHTKSIPIVLLSARAGESSRLEGLECGADDYLVKPFSAKELLVRIRSTLELSRLRSACIRSEQMLKNEEKTAEILREENRKKDDFLAMLAHELRNPLAAISSAIQMTRRDDEVSRIIEHQSQHLVRIIDDLLDISRISHGKIELRREVIECKPILNKVIESLQPVVRAREQTITLSFNCAPLRLYADRVRLEQILMNMLTNAIKYTPSGGKIYVDLGREKDLVLIKVKDTGVGIPPELLGQVFDLFVQGKQSIARSQGGLGIGLTLVKTLTEMHGGTVEVFSAGLNQGSEFTLRFPAVEAGASSVERIEKSRDLLQYRKRRVLIVDDNKDISFLLSQMAKIAGHDVRVAYDGISAVEEAQNFHPNVMLLDLGLPGMTGYEVVSRLRADKAFKETVIVAISGYGQEEDKKRSNQAGFDFHFVKPVNHDAVLRILNS